jgi:zinc transporter 1
MSLGGKRLGNEARLVFMFLLTASYFLVEIIVGYVSNSMALVADSFHMLSDVAALIIAFIAVLVSS